ncbi:hypothetical protein ACJIZ3_007919 [Penstemon smallii]|uniref:Uncharacterized protein n=1 Tax=Penstemon smallii TaxID=265156 RepID=A0ABD3T9B1_9LAMI
MAGSELQRQLLTLICDSSTEKPKENQKKQIGKLRSELETANSELEEANMYPNFSSEMSALKIKENTSRDGLIEKILGLNAHIREFQELLASSIKANFHCEATWIEGSVTRHQHGAEMAVGVLDNKFAAQLVFQKEQQYNTEQVIHNLEVINLEALLLDSLMKESMELQDKQTPELEEECAALGNELHKRFLFPRCHQENSEELAR